MTSYPQAPNPDQQPTQQYTGPQYPYPPQQGQPSGPQLPVPPRKRKKWPYFAGGALALIAIIAVASNNGDSTKTTSTAAATTAAAPSSVSRFQAAIPATQAPAVAQAPAAPATPAGPATTAEDGTYEVGTDLAPGQYKTAGPDKSDIIPNCYWARLKNDSGEFSAIISNGNLQGPGSVTVKKGEYLQLTGGCLWTKK